MAQDIEVQDDIIVTRGTLISTKTVLDSLAMSDTVIANAVTRKAVKILHGIEKQ